MMQRESIHMYCMQSPRVISRASWNVFDNSSQSIPASRSASDAFVVFGTCPPLAVPQQWLSARYLVPPLSSRPDVCIKREVMDPLKVAGPISISRVGRQSVSRLRLHATCFSRQVSIHDRANSKTEREDELSSTECPRLHTRLSI